ncbi:MAG: hypothetical protein Q7T55_15470 [Solirubrobacteraceae bacterium]|nr:hypothetical protein [Solirubrobacteraceae bacterium]
MTTPCATAGRRRRSIDPALASPWRAATLDGFESPCSDARNFHAYPGLKEEKRRIDRLRSCASPSPPHR